MPKLFGITKTGVFPRLGDLPQDAIGGGGTGGTGGHRAGLGADSYQLHDLEQITELLSLSFSLCKKVECYLLCSCQDSERMHVKLPGNDSYSYPQLRVKCA